MKKGKPRASNHNLHRSTWTKEETNASYLGLNFPVQRRALWTRRTMGRMQHQQCQAGGECAKSGQPLTSHVTGHGRPKGGPRLKCSSRRYGGAEDASVTVSRKGPACPPAFHLAFRRRETDSGRAYWRCVGRVQALQGVRVL